MSIAPICYQTSTFVPKSGQQDLLSGDSPGCLAYRPGPHDHIHVRYSRLLDSLLRCYFFCISLFLIFCLFAIFQGNIFHFSMLYQDDTRLVSLHRLHNISLGSLYFLIRFHVTYPAPSVTMDRSMEVVPSLKPALFQLWLTDGMWK